MDQEFLQQGSFHIISHCREEANDSRRLLVPIFLHHIRKRWFPPRFRQRSLTLLVERFRRAIYAVRIWYDSLEKSHASGLSPCTSSCSHSPSAGSSSPSLSTSMSSVDRGFESFAAQKHFP